MQTKTGFIFQEDLIGYQPEPGITRQLLGYDEKMMMLKISFEKGAIGSMHQHPHTQATYVVSGSFEFTINGETKIVKQGDACFMPANIPHGCTCLEAGSLIDVFTPLRNDFLPEQ